MAKPKLGNQLPTQSVIIPYKDTLGQETIKLYNSTGRTALEWQVLLMYDILAVNKEGLWTHSKYGYAVRYSLAKVLMVTEPLVLVSIDCFCYSLAKFLMVTERKNYMRLLQISYSLA